MNTKHLKAKILDLAIRGKLVPQDTSEGNAADLFEKIRDEKAELIKQKKVKADKNSSFIIKADDGKHYEQFADGTLKDIEDEIPFEIPESWYWVRLRDIGIYKKGPFGSALTKAMFVPKSDLTIKVYEQQNAIKKNHELGHYYIKRDYFESDMKGFEVHPGDIIVSCAGTIGETYILPENIEKGIINQALMKMTITNKLNIQFFLMYFDHILKSASDDSGKGTAMKNIPPFDIFKQFLFPLPPLSEQQRIVSAIEKAFEQIDIIEKNKLSLKTYIKQTKSKVLDLAIHGKLVEQNPKEGNAADLLKIEEVIQDDIPFEIPMNWCWCRLTSLCEYGKCKNADPSELKPDSWILDLEDIEKDTGVIKCIKTFSERNSLSTKHFFTKGTVLYSKLRPYLNKVVIAPKDGFCTSEILPLDFKGKYINAFAQKLLMSPYFLSTVNMLTYGVKMPRLGTNEAKQILLPLPPLEEQQRIVERIEQIFEQLYILEKSIGE